MACPTSTKAHYRPVPPTPAVASVYTTSPPPRNSKQSLLCDQTLSLSWTADLWMIPSITNNNGRNCSICGWHQSPSVRRQCHVQRRWRKPFILYQQFWRIFGGSTLNCKNWKNKFKIWTDLSGLVMNTPSLIVKNKLCKMGLILSFSPGLLIEVKWHHMASDIWSAFVQVMACHPICQLDH